MSAISLKEYFARQGSRFTDEDAKIIGPELEKLAIEGQTTAHDIVENAKNTDSALHQYFEWADETAANLYRETQARHMANSITIRIKTNEGDKEIRAFHAIKVVTTEEENQIQKSYISIDKIADNTDMMGQVVEEARKALLGWKERYNIYQSMIPAFKQEFTPVIEAIGKLEKKEEKLKVAS
jgi:macrodomain Ter protein organizer (MatP/YcbG family)